MSIRTAPQKTFLVGGWVLPAPGRRPPFFQHQPMINWNNIPNSTPLSPHLTVGEFTRGVSHSYLNRRKLSPAAPLAVATVFELARRELNVLIDELPPAEREFHSRGIMVSSGVRTPSTNGGAKASRHMLGPDYCAMDFRPQGNWNGSAIPYDDFYGCFIRALEVIEEPFGLGYYVRSKSGIHIDCSFDLRARQHKSFGLAKHGIPRGYRWGPRGFSFRGNEKVLARLHKDHSKNVVIDPQPWLEWAKELGVNLKLMEG